MDFMKSLASLAGADVPEGAGTDGVNVLPAMLGEQKVGRETLIEQGGGVTVAVRKGNWKLIPKGGGARNGGKVNRAELYDLAKESGEKEDLAENRPEVVKALMGGVTEAEK